MKTGFICSCDDAKLGKVSKFVMLLALMLVSDLPDITGRTAKDVVNAKYHVITGHVR